MHDKRPVLLKRLAKSDCKAFFIHFRAWVEVEQTSSQVYSINTLKEVFITQGKRPIVTNVREKGLKEAQICAKKYNRQLQVFDTPVKLTARDQFCYKDW